MPASIEVREVQVRVSESGFRTESFVVITTLTNAASVSLAKHVVGNRPGRIEPRAVKRRPKPHDLLTKPRAQTRAELIGAKSP